MSLDDLQVGTVVKGTVQNVVDFGAFVDFGLKTAGLIHRSELSTRPFKHPLDILHTGDIVEAQIIGVEARELPFRCKEVHDISWKMASEQVAE